MVRLRFAPRSLISTYLPLISPNFILFFEKLQTLRESRLGSTTAKLSHLQIVRFQIPHSGCLNRGKSDRFLCFGGAGIILECPKRYSSSSTNSSELDDSATGCAGVACAGRRPSVRRGRRASPPATELLPFALW